jgi:DNA-binding response OmpR family regulator
MRPKKVILLADANEDRAAVLACTFWVRGFKVLWAPTPQEAAVYLSQRIAIVIATMDSIEGIARTGHLKEIAPWVPMILLTDRTKMGDTMHRADAVLELSTCSSEELIERVKWMSARKRGPRKGSIRKPPQPALPERAESRTA